MHESVLELNNVWVYYGKEAALEDINLQVAANTFLGIIGPNGGGKTTLLKVILGLIKPACGSVQVMGKTPGEGRHRIGYVSQHNLFDRSFPINVRDVVLMGRYRHTGLFRRYRREDIALAEEALVTVGMAEYRNKQIGALSGGEQQRVFIARALVSEPALLLLDEPTASIDPTMQSEFYELTERLKQKMSIIMVSHDITAVSVHVDNVACLNHHLFYHGKNEEIPADVLTQLYQCPVQFIAHGAIPHRVLGEHSKK